MKHSRTAGLSNAIVVICGAAVNLPSLRPHGDAADLIIATALPLLRKSGQLLDVLAQHCRKSPSNIVAAVDVHLSCLSTLHRCCWQRLMSDDAKLKHVARLVILL